jgi:excisionase family DNA binding protein
MKAELLLSPEFAEHIANIVIKNIEPLLRSRQIEKDILFDLTEVCEYLRVTKKWIYDRTRLDNIPHSKLGGRLRFRKRDIDKWVDELAAGKVRPAAATSRRTAKTKGRSW